MITVIIIPVSGWIVTLISRFVRKEYQKQWYYTGMINSNVEESVNGHNIVKALWSGREVRGSFQEAESSAV